MTPPTPARLVGPPLVDDGGPPTLAGRLRRAADLDAPGAGLRFLDRQERETWLPWPEVARRAARAAGALAARGVRPGDRVAIILPTDPAFADAFFGCQHLGAVPVALYPPIRLGRLDEYHRSTAAMLRAADARIVVTEARVNRVLGQTLARAKPPLGVLLADALGGPEAPLADPDPDALAMVQFSSGTTVDPKPVGLTHRQVLAQATALLDRVNATGPHATRAGVSWLPLYHDMGLIGCIFPALCQPGPLTLIPPEAFLARPALWLRAISRHRGTVSPAPDFAFALCVDRARDDELAGVDLSSWRLALNGAEPVRPATLRRFAERFAPYGFDPTALTPVYGLSEASLAVTFSASDRPPNVLRVDRTALASGRAEPSDAPDALAIVSVGAPVPGFDVEIRSDGGEPLPAGTVGRIAARGPSVMAGYLGTSGAAIPGDPIRDGWLDTGDLGFIADGELFVAGRAKDVIIVRGRNHAPHEVEAAVDAVPGVRTGCAVAVARIDDAGERVVLFVEVREPAPGQAEACRRAALEASGVAIDEIVLVAPGTLPRTSSGKLRRAEALRRHLAGTLAPPSAVNAVTIAGAIASSAIGRLGWVIGED
jgi:fatty-acyl-CoA synthase